MRVTEEEFTRLSSRATGKPLQAIAEVARFHAKKAVSEVLATDAGQTKRKPMRARVTRRIAGQMNKLEAEYAAAVLEPQKLAGEILEYWFEKFTFKLADDCRYTPDFVVQLANGEMECHETKGYWQEDAKVKIRVAAELFPFRFVAIQKLPKKDGGGWKHQEF
jgi:hypothetical protein